MNFPDATSQFPAGVSPKVNELLASVECGYHKVNGNLTTFYHHIGMVKIMTAPTGSTNTTSINYLYMHGQCGLIITKSLFFSVY